MKKCMIKPAVRVVRLSNQDIITTSQETLSIGDNANDGDEGQVQARRSIWD